MPELPEVETMRRGIAPIVGQRIEQIEIVPCERRPVLVEPGLRQFRKRAVGQVVAAVERLGKRVVIRLASDDRIVFEPRMTGLVLVADPPSAEHLRFRIDFVSGRLRHVWYWDRRGLGSVRLMTARQMAEAWGERVGPDALTIELAEFRRRLERSRRPIKVALLDQKALAGVGNLYASELLHVARIHPATPCDALEDEDWEGIHAALRGVLEEAVRYEGSTLSDGTYRNALNQVGGYQNHHRVYDRAGEWCRSCSKNQVERVVQAQRATFFCRNCQPERL